jgi:photosystem II stability/assembly factor-like uncharacterized protein
VGSLSLGGNIILGVVAATTDGGVTWVAHDPGTGQLGAVSCGNDSICFALGANGTFLTTDGGSTWTQSAPFEGPFGPAAISCPAPHTCVVVGGLGLIQVTTNRGATWTPRHSTVTTFPPLTSTGFPNFLTDVSCPSANACFAVGDLGTIVATTNNGATWTAQTSGTSERIDGINCPSSSTCYAVSEGAGVLTTTNGGANWSIHNIGLGGANAISCPSTTTCYASAFSGFLVTNDGGTTWTTLSLSPTLGAISCPSLTTCFAPGPIGVIFATTDGGSTWTSQTYNSIFGVGGISCPSTTTCVASSAGVVETTDGGITWRFAQAGRSVGGAISCASDTTCFDLYGDQNGFPFFGGGAIAMFSTVDGLVLQDSPTVAELRGISCQSSTCRVVGMFGTIVADHDVPLQPAGHGFGLSAGPLQLLGSALLSWTAGTQQSGYDILRFAAGRNSLSVLPPGGSPLPAPAQSYRDVDTLSQSYYCYVLGPLSGATSLGASDPICLAPHTHSASGAPPSFTLRMNQSSTASLTWTPPGGQIGYVLQAVAGNGSTHYQILAVTATSATDDTAGQPTCYVLIPLANGSAMGNSDAECGVPAAFSVAAPQPRAAPTLTNPAAIVRNAVSRLPDIHRLPRTGNK